MSSKRNTGAILMGCVIIAIAGIGLSAFTAFIIKVLYNYVNDAWNGPDVSFTMVWAFLLLASIVIGVVKNILHETK